MRDSLSVQNFRYEQHEPLMPGDTCSSWGGSIPLSPHPPLLKLDHVQDTGTSGPAQHPVHGCVPEARREPPNSFQEQQEGENFQGC